MPFRDPYSPSPPPGNDFIQLPPWPQPRALLSTVNLFGRTVPDNFTTRYKFIQYCEKFSFPEDIQGGFRHQYVDFTRMLVQQWYLIVAYRDVQTRMPTQRGRDEMDDKVATEIRFVRQYLEDHRLECLYVPRNALMVILEYYLTLLCPLTVMLQEYVNEAFRARLQSRGGRRANAIRKSHERKQEDPLIEIWEYLKVDKTTDVAHWTYVCWVVVRIVENMLVEEEAMQWPSPPTR